MTVPFLRHLPSLDGRGEEERHRRERGKRGTSKARGIGRANKETRSRRKRKQAPKDTETRSGFPDPIDRAHNGREGAQRHFRKLKRGPISRAPSIRAISPYGYLVKVPLAVPPSGFVTVTVTGTPLGNRALRPGPLSLSWLELL